MTTMASQITSLTIVYSTVYSDADERKHQNSDEFPAQMASNSENVSIWWRHHDPAAIIGTSVLTQPVISWPTILVSYIEVRSLQISWWSSTRRLHLRVPDLQMSCRDFTTLQGTRMVASGAVAGWYNLDSPAARNIRVWVEYTKLWRYNRHVNWIDHSFFIFSYSHMIALPGHFTEVT